MTVQIWKLTTGESQYNDYAKIKRLFAWSDKYKRAGTVIVSSKSQNIRICLIHILDQQKQIDAPVGGETLQKTINRRPSIGKTLLLK